MRSAPLEVTETKFTPASDRDEQRGLIGYVAVVLNGALRLDGVTLRRSSAGELYLAYPARTDRSGMRHALLRPLDDEARRALQGQVFAALGIDDMSRPALDRSHEQQAQQGREARSKKRR